MTTPTFMGLVAALSLSLEATNAADPPPKQNQPTVDETWEAVRKAARQPDPPAAWGNKPPNDEQRQEYRDLLAERSAEAATKARDFYTAYPDHPRADEAKRLEQQLLRTALRFGNDTVRSRLEDLDQQPPAPRLTPEDQRFQERVRAARAAAMAKQPEGMPAVLAEYESQVRALQKDFPNQPEVYVMLLEVASSSPPEKARAIIDEILPGPATERTKTQAGGLAKRLERLGQPFPLKFKALDGRDVDLTALRGKVILLDFWATWCGPCVAEIPNVKAAYEKLHERGFEIVGISFDHDRDALAAFLKKQEMPWPQYFDGQGWGNALGKEYGINSIPAMWLIDREGRLCDLNARGDLERKVGLLLDPTPSP